MPNPKHYHGKLHLVDSNHNGKIHLCVEGETNKAFATVHNRVKAGMIDVEEGCENARRLAACWNLLVALPTETIEAFVALQHPLHPVKLEV